MRFGATDLISLKELDAAWAARKGAAFRVFKRMLPDLIAGRDFVYLSAQCNGAEIERLRAAQRIYAGSINVVMLTASGVHKLAPP